MMESAKITAMALIAFMASQPHPISIGVSLLFGVYILNMLYFNVIRPEFNGSFREWLRFWVRKIRSKK